MDRHSLEKKVCPKCGIEKPFTDFHKSSRGPTFLQSWCKTCQNSKKYKRTPEFYRKHDLKRNFGISVEDYERMFNEQFGKCAICKNTETAISQTTKQPYRLAVDHNHETSEVRGLLCSNCNTGLGRFKDNIDYLSSAIKYLTASVDDIR